MALACGDSYYMPPASARRMAADLSVLPAWYAAPGDAVLTDVAPHDIQMKALSPLLPAVEFVTGLSSSYTKISPWGWNPSLLRRLHEAGITDSACLTDEKMKRVRELSGRQTAVRVLSSIHRGQRLYSSSAVSEYNGAMEDFPTLPEDTEAHTPFVGESFLFHTEEEVEYFVRSYPQAVLKSPWSGSGRGIQYTSGAFTRPLKGWVQHVLHTQQAVVGEPFYDKVKDFAMEFFSNGKGEVRFAGYSLFETDKRGIYKENFLAADADILKKLSAYVPTSVFHRLCRRMADELAHTIGGYEGYLGVDMMICRTSLAKTGYAIHPCVEINLRMNMGVVARMVYDRYVCDRVQGRYAIEYYASPGEAEQADRFLRLQHPLLLEGGRIKSGYLSLTPIYQQTAYQAYILVGTI